MTTIAYDGATVAGDRFWGGCYGDKVVRIGNLIIGFTGEAKNFNRVKDYFQSGGDEPDIGECDVLVVDAVTGKARVYDGEMDPLDVDVPIAVGSGAHIALGVMWTGKSAEAAVRAAAVFDPNTKTDHGITAFEVDAEHK